MRYPELGTYNRIVEESSQMTDSLPCWHMTSKQRLIDVDATLKRHTDVDMTLFKVACLLGNVFAARIYKVWLQRTQTFSPTGYLSMGV